MSWYNIFRQEKTNASVAKSRLQVIVAHQRSNRAGQLDYLPQLQREILEVIRKYVSINEDAVQVNRNDELEVLELNIALPEAARVGG